MERYFLVLRRIDIDKNTATRIRKIKRKHNGSL